MPDQPFPTAPRPTYVAPARKPAPTSVGPKDSAREIAETLVFVVALVLMLKLFVVEAFVIPTGSMAETLYGYQKLVTCSHCEHEFPVNASNEADPQDGVRRVVTGATCPNCRQRVTVPPPPKLDYGPGDRVLVHKGLYTLTGGPERGDVVVFKYPVEPQINHTATNYIKRLHGLGDETLAIYRGDLYVNRELRYPEGATDGAGRVLYPRPENGDQLKLWSGAQVNADPRARNLGGFTEDYTYHNTQAAVEAFAASRAGGFRSGFTLLQKSAAQSLAMRRLVYDNDQPALDLAKAGVPPRWQGDGFRADNALTPKVFAHTGEGQSWLRYAHRIPGAPGELRDAAGTPVLDPNGNPAVADDFERLARGGYQDGLFAPAPITNFLGYNAGEEDGRQTRTGNGQFWVPDLMIECRVTPTAESDEVTLELGRGGRRFQAVFAGGRVTFRRLGPGGGDSGTSPARLKVGSATDLRFADFDGVLRAWVNGREVEQDSFKAGFDPWGDREDKPTAVAGLVGAVASAGPDGLSAVNDIAAPASVGVRGSVEVSRLKLWADTYFTPAENQFYTTPPNERDDPIDTFYVQPGHYLCLGDNSGQSSDGRKWGLVPDRLLLGKAQMVFWPLPRIGVIK